jgi:hypothetical protein
LTNWSKPSPVEIKEKNDRTCFHVHLTFPTFLLRFVSSDYQLSKYLVDSKL